MESFTVGVSVTGWSWEKYWSLNLRPLKVQVRHESAAELLNNLLSQASRQSAAEMSGYVNRYGLFGVDGLFQESMAINLQHDV